MGAALTPWASIYDVLGRYAPELINDTTGEIEGDQMLINEWLGWLDYSTWMLWILSRGNVHAEECWIDEYIVYGYKVQLRHLPLLTVVKVESVSACGSSAPEEITYCLSDASTLDFRSSGIAACDPTVRVYYRTDSTLPPATEALVGWLTSQFMLSSAGKACELPQRVQSIARQGVSWTMIDPMDFIEKGTTGMGRVDTWMMLANKAMPSSRLIDPLRTRIKTSRRVACDCGEFDPGSFSSDFNITSDLVG